MSELGKSARELVELARDGDDPRPEDRARVRRKITAAVAVGATTSITQAAAAKALGATAALGATSAPTATATLSAAKVAALVIGGLSLGIVGAGAYGVTMPEAPPKPSAVGAHGPANPARAQLRAHSDDQARPAPTLAPEQKSDDADSLEAPLPRRAAARLDSPIPAAPPQVGPSTLADETRLLERARSALSEDRPRDALALAAVHERSYPAGVLAEEAAVTRILALCRLGRRDEARSVARRFGRLAPNSPLRARVDSSCAGATLFETDPSDRGHSSGEGVGTP